MHTCNLHVFLGIKTGFKEIVQRHPSRFEMTYKMDAIFDHLLHPNIFQLARKILHTENIDIINKSLVVSLPGSGDQGWHIDGPHMSTEQYFPCHCFNVFIPLIDILPVHGPTEFRPGSQELTRDMKKLFVPKLLTGRLPPIQGPCLKKGSALLFDYRVLHRGKANKSAVRRPIIVFTFAREGSRDVLNFPKRSVYDEVDSLCANDDGDEGDGGRVMTASAAHPVTVFASASVNTANTATSATTALC